MPYANLTNPQTLNLYAMVSDNPETFADLDGHQEEDETEEEEAEANEIRPTFGRAAPGQSLTPPLAAPADVCYADSPSTREPAKPVDPGITSSDLKNSGQGSNIAANAEKGAAFEKAVVQETMTTDTNVEQHVTLQTESGVKTNMDVVSKKPTGKVRLQEAKSSAKARLTRDQRKAHPEIAKSGATVVGKGKPGYPGGTVIPPTNVEVVRPKPPR